MATKTITSEQSETKVGTAGTKLYTKTRVTYTLDQNGNIDPNLVKQEILYQQVPGDPLVVAATRNGTSGDFTFNKNSITGETYFGADAQKSLKTGALKTSTNHQIQTASKKEGLTPEQTKAILGASSTATTAPTNPDGPSAEQQKDTAKLFNEATSIARETYNGEQRDVRYPEDLQLDQQDCIQFSIFKYIPSTVSLEQNLKRRRLTGKKPIGTITLSIPGGISDSNQADWQKDDLNIFQKDAADLLNNFFLGGANAAANSAQTSLNAIGADTKALEAFVAVKGTQTLLGSNIFSRQFGAVENPNSELLFSGPQLRTFSFTFRMYPRSQKEAKIVQKIIRYFKQAMAVQRSKSVLILKAPNTFGIKYLTSGGGEHPYLNRFKECALTQCNVNYTPDGTYMTYAGEPSMTAYELQLQFQELEPIFNDDYTALDKDDDNSKEMQIGY